MARSTKLMVVSAVACALTLAVFMASYGSLPESVPVQFGLAGRRIRTGLERRWCSACPRFLSSST